MHHVAVEQYSEIMNFESSRADVRVSAFLLQIDSRFICKLHVYALMIE